MLMMQSRPSGWVSQARILMLMMETGWVSQGGLLMLPTHDAHAVHCRWLCVRRRFADVHDAHDAYDAHDTHDAHDAHDAYDALDAHDSHDALDALMLLMLIIESAEPSWESEEGLLMLMMQAGVKAPYSAWMSKKTDAAADAHDAVPSRWLAVR